MAANPSKVKAGLDAISQLIAGAKQQQERAKTQLVTARNQLAAIPQQFGAEIAEIDGYAPDGAFETLAKSERDELAAEFTALKTAIEAELTALGITF